MLCVVPAPSQTGVVVDSRQSVWQLFASSARVWFVAQAPPARTHRHASTHTVVSRLRTASLQVASQPPAEGVVVPPPPMETSTRPLGMFPNVLPQPHQGPNHAAPAMPQMPPHTRHRNGVPSHDPHHPAVLSGAVPSPPMSPHHFGAPGVGHGVNPATGSVPITGSVPLPAAVSVPVVCATPRTMSSSVAVEDGDVSDVESTVVAQSGVHHQRRRVSPRQELAATAHKEDHVVRELCVCASQCFCGVCRHSVRVSRTDVVGLEALLPSPSIVLSMFVVPYPGAPVTFAIPAHLGAAV